MLGPVVVIASFANEEEAINAANNTTYGLGSAVFTNDLKRAHRVAAEIEAGMVWINSTQDCDPRIPFGGTFRTTQERYNWLRLTFCRSQA
jgi:aldehyde dehydrogenase (NAD+)